MGLFKAIEKKKLRKANAEKRAMITDLIASMKRTCKDPRTVSLLGEITLNIQSQPVPDTQEALTFGTEILALLEEAKNSLLEQNPVACVKLLEARDKVVAKSDKGLLERILQKNGNLMPEDREILLKALNDAKDREILLKALDDANEELRGIEREAEWLEDLLRESPGDMAIIARIRATRIKGNACGSRIERIWTFLSGCLTTCGVIAPPSMIEDSYGGLRDIDIEIRPLLEEAPSMFEDLLRFPTEKGMPTPFDPFGEASPVMSDLKRAQQAIERSIEKSNESMEDANDELRDFEAELRPLLERRRTATPSERYLIDGQIDRLRDKRNSAVNKIKRFRQEAAKLADKLALLDKLSACPELTDAEIERLTEGRIRDLAGISSFLDDVVIKDDEPLMGSIAAFADVEVDATEDDTTEDDDKYVELEREIGLRIL